MTIINSQEWKSIKYRSVLENKGRRTYEKSVLGGFT